jgi:hypothetical protein
MSKNYRLKSGQINFESTVHSGSYSCVVIKDGKFFNLTDQLRSLLLEALNGPETEEMNIEDMF